MPKRKRVILASLLALPWVILALTALILFLTIDRGGIGRDLFIFSPNAKNKYPIILHHGFMPVSSLHKFARFLQSKGFNTYSTEVAAANTIEFRAKQLAQQIDIVLAETKAPKVNIIAHSMGGLDARYLISTLGYQDRVASLTTISTPHLGSHLCDYLVATDRRSLAVILNLIGIISVPGTNFKNADSKVVGHDLSSNYILNTFNPANPNAPGVYYQSWAASCETAEGCNIKPILYLSHSYLGKLVGPNDGLIAVSEAKWGEFRGVLPTDHFSEIDSRVFFEINNFDAYGFFESVAAELSQKGF